MGMKKILIAGAIVVVLGAVGFAVASEMNGEDAMMKDEAMMQKDTMATTSDSMMKDDKDAMMKGDTDAMVDVEAGAMMHQ
jgi:predicted outer membrane protein